MSKANDMADAIELAKHVKFWREKHRALCDNIWRALYPNGDTAGEYEYPDQIIREVGQLRELAIALGWDGKSIIEPKLSDSAVISQDDAREQYFTETKSGTTTSADIDRQMSSLNAMLEAYDSEEGE